MLLSYRMRSWAGARSVVIGSALLGFCATPVSAQVPPPETNSSVLIDVGPVPVPVACSCITFPFTVPKSRPGWGYGSGPAAPEGNATPTEAQRARQAKLDAEERATIPHNAEDGLAGNPHASISLAYQLSWGTAIARNEQEASRWFHLAAEQGHPDARLQLGYRYLHGRGVQQNDGAAAYWYHAAASRGDKVAMAALGMLYAAGRGVRQDWAAAVRWWQQSRVPLALRFLGDAYTCGLGGDLDFPSAALAYREAADAGELSSSVQLGHMHVAGCAPSTDEKAVAAYKLAADQGDPEAQIALSDLYRQGRGVEPDAHQAYMWARLAELRLSPGDLRTQAAAHAAQAARLMPAANVKHMDEFIESVLREGSRSMK